MKKAIIIAGKEIQDHEFVYPFYRLEEEGYVVDVAVKNKEIVYGSIGVRVTPTKDIPELNIDEYEVLILPGGAKAIEYMRQDKDLLKFISNFHESGKVIGSICHAGSLLISAGLVRGRKISGYYSIRDDINNAGGNYIDAPFVTDDRIVSSPHYKHLGPWMKEVISQTNILNYK